MKRSIGWFLLFFLLTAFFLILARPLYEEKPSTAAVIDIHTGMTVHDLALQLEQKGIIVWPEFFTRYAAWKNLDRGIRPGRYQVDSAMDYQTLLAVVSDPENAVQHTVMFPEGLTLTQIAPRMEAAGLMPEDEFLEFVMDKENARRLAGPEAETLEGYLFPDTYRYSPLDPPESLLEYMVSRCLHKITPDLRAAAEENGLTLHQLVILASIIEEEAVVAEERPIISSVFHNRLRRGMLLQADPTILYGKGDPGGTIYLSDLRRDHPYNTYTRPGLPPGPICNPGEASLRAAAFPAQTDYLYFVALGDGTGRHHFSRTLAEHNQAVRIARRR